MPRDIKNDNILRTMKLHLLRQAAYLYYGICPVPTTEEYSQVAKTLYDEFPALHDKHLNTFIIVTST